eukprot:TRINITY_DN6148_c0_g1_i1.p1 TRINITY_DN6148_c0_g1~~TRINITY_DN6148_c0_g1_i1.p1  ORF type:complete len:828 (+),score=147.92 TRINITY_DN6148_c0_g1_i1:85-2568(+)
MVDYISSMSSQQLDDYYHDSKRPLSSSSSNWVSCNRSRTLPSMNSTNSSSSDLIRSSAGNAGLNCSTDTNPDSNSTPVVNPLINSSPGVMNAAAVKRNRSDRRGIGTLGISGAVGSKPHSVIQTEDVCNSPRAWVNANQKVKKANYSFKVEKINRSRNTLNKVIEIDLIEKWIRSYHPSKQKTVQRSANDLIRATRSVVNHKKLKLHWRTSVSKSGVERLLFPSSELRERFYELTTFLSNSRLPPPPPNLSIFTATWNLGSAPPPADLSTLFNTEKNQYDLIAVAVQECEYNARGEYTSCEMDWFGTVNDHLGDAYFKVEGISLLQMRLGVWAHKRLGGRIKNVKSATKATGIGNVYGNKGGVGISLECCETTICFVGSHLAAREERVFARNANFAAIVDGLGLGRHSNGDITHGFHYLFWMGDLNYRIELARDETLRKITERDWAALKASDQLEREKGRGNCFYGFEEGSIDFAPTYRYNRGDRTYSEEKMRTPSYCDRILWKKFPGLHLKLHKYGPIDDLTSSDHSPVYAVFEIENLNINDPRQETLAREASPGSAYIIKLSNLCAKLQAPVDVLLPAGSSPTALMNNVHSARFEVKNCSVTLKSISLFEGEATTEQSWGTIPRWIDKKVMVFTVNRNFIEKQYILFVVKEEGKVWGQGVIGIFPGADKRKLEVPLTRAGIRVGVIEGQIEVAFEEKINVQTEDMEEGKSQLVNPGSSVAKQGFLMKQGAKRKSWKRRWFVLYTQGKLSYFTNQAAAKPLSTFSIVGCTVQEESSRKHGFNIITNDRIFYISADNEIEKQGWIDELQAVCYRHTSRLSSARGTIA